MLSDILISRGEKGTILFLCLLMFCFLCWCFCIQRKSVRSKPDERVHSGVFSVLGYVWGAIGLIWTVMKVLLDLLKIPDYIAGVISKFVQIENISTWVNQKIQPCIPAFVTDAVSVLVSIAKLVFPVEPMISLISVPKAFSVTFIILFVWEIVTKRAVQTKITSFFKISDKVKFFQLLPKKGLLKPVANCLSKIRSFLNRLFKIRSFFSLLNWIDLFPAMIDRCFFGFYEYDSKLERYFLKEQWKWPRYIMPFIIILILLMGTFTLAYCYSSQDNQTAYSMMIFPLLIAAEIWMACAIDTREEFDYFRRKDVKGKDEKLAGLRKTAKDIVKQLKEERPDEKIYVETYYEEASPDLKKNRDTELTKMSPEEDLVESYIDLCQKQGNDIDLALCDVTSILLQEKRGVVFATRFYQDIDYSFYLPMLRTVHSGNYCLVISGDSVNENAQIALKDWLLAGREKIIGSSGFWRIGNACDIGEKFEIGIMTAEDLGKAELLKNRRDFFEKVHLVLIINASALLHKQMFGIINLRRILPEKCSFAICNDNAEGLEAIYSHLLHINIKTVQPTTRSAKWTQILLLDRDKSHGMDPMECKQLAIAEMALCGAVEKVRWYGSSEMPIRDIESRYQNGVDEFSTEKAQKKKVVFGTYDFPCAREDCACTIVEDNIHNPAELSHQFASRGKDGIIVVVISDQYMFLDYIRTHLQEFYLNVHEITQWFPAYCTTRRNAVLELCWIMEQHHLQVEDIKEVCLSLQQPDLISELNLDQNNPQEIQANLENCFNGVLSDQLIVVRYEEPDGYYLKWIDTNSGRPNIYLRKNSCWYVGIDPHKKVPLPQYSEAELYQKYLPGQTIALDGNEYDIVDISVHNDNVTMYVRRNGSNLQLGKEYLQIRTATLTSKESKERHIYHFGDLAIEEYETDIIIETENYLVKTGDKWEDSIILPDKIKSKCRRAYSQKAILKITTPDRKILKVLMLLMNELFQTIYAEYKDQLLVCAASKADETIAKDSLNVVRVRNWVLDNKVWQDFDAEEYYIIEDSNEDIGLLLSICNNFERFLCIIDKYLAWLYGEEN